MAKKTSTSAPKLGVSSVTSKIKSTIPLNGTMVATPEETQQRKRNYLSTIDSIIAKFQDNVETGKLQITSVADFERLVKLSLLLSGEADSITGKAGETEVSAEVMKLSMSKIEEILKEDDPEVIAMYNKLYEEYNKLNDIDE